MSGWSCNGEAISAVPIGDRAFQYGDGLFETIAIRDGQPRLWHFHLERLELGCKKLGLTVPDRDNLRAWLDAAVADSPCYGANCRAKIILSAGVSESGYARSMPGASTVYIGVFATSPISPQYYDEGVDTIVCDTRLAAYSITAGCKTLNRIEQVLARSECVGQGAFEGFMRDAEGRLICGTMSNVFILSNDRIATPSLERCGVAGVMRRHTIDLLRQHGQKVTIRGISEVELLRADGVFLCNSQLGIVPVRRCGDKEWPVHPMTRSAMALLAENGIGECDR